MEAYKDEAPKTTTIKNGSNFASDDEVVKAALAFFKSLNEANFLTMSVVKWAERVK